MTCQNILKMGNKQLMTPSQSILDLSTLQSSHFKNLIDDMHDTMQAKAGVGIAAPQIGHHLRVIMFGFEHNNRYPQEKPVPFTVLINPEYQILSEDIVDGWEGCLSVPGLRGLVGRHHQIAYTGYDLKGKLIKRIAEGFHARIIQHECDHLDGVLFPYRVQNMQFFGFEDELGMSF